METEAKYMVHTAGVRAPEQSQEWQVWEDAWQQVLVRDAAADLLFVYAVTTTGVACRPSCPSRRPARHNVRFFKTVEAAIAEGYRPCLRCQPGRVHEDARIVERLCAFLQAKVERPVTLGELSKLSGLNAFATQRLFQRVMGVSPRHYQMSLRAASMRDRLAAMKNSDVHHGVTVALYEAGYSGSSRLYEESGRTLGMKPAHFRDGGAGETIHACVAPCPLGFLLAARTERGLCHVALGDKPEVLEAELRERFYRASVHLGEPEAADETLPLKQILSLLEEHPVALDLPMDLRATAFQQRVWQALREIPRGETRSYAQIAQALGQPTASRAVARACASNSLALIVPCHRVIGSDGDLRGYKWGKARKQKLLSLEAAKVNDGSGSLFRSDC